MKSYIEEELAKGFIRPSTSPASVGFFFVKKDEDSVRALTAELSMILLSSSDTPYH